MKVSIGTLVAELVVMFLVFVLLLFIPAGTFRWWAGWIFLVIFFGVGIVMVLWALKVNPGLLNERMTGLGQANQQSWDRPIVAIIITLYVAWVVVMPLDAVRFHLSHIPLWGQVVGGVLYSISFYLLFLVYRENSYLSPAARIQKERGQTVISTGPYRYVRHPMYATFLVQFVGGSLLLGSWAGVVVGLLITAVMARRAVLEEQMLRAELPGYAEYMTRVKYRLIPHIW